MGFRKWAKSNCRQKAQVLTSPFSGGVVLKLWLDDLKYVCYPINDPIFECMMEGIILRGSLRVFNTTKDDKITRRYSGITNCTRTAKR